MTVEELSKALADSLEKSGAKHSKETIDSLQKISHSINEMGGACQCDKCQGIYNTAKAAENADLNKIDFQKAMEGYADMKKTLDGLVSDNEALRKEVKDLKDAPLPGGPIATGTISMNKSIGTDEQTQPSSEIEAWDVIINKAHDPQEVQHARMQKANILMKQTLTGKQ